MAIAHTRAWVEVDLDAVRANYDTVRRRAGSAMIPVVKADAYGAGMGRVVRALEPLEPWGYGVATVAEGGALRELGVTRPILVLSPLPDGDAAAAAAARLTPAISSLEGLRAWVAAANAADGLDFHVEIDTGMGRSGFDWREAGQWAQAVRREAGDVVRWTGVFTHFHSADAPDPGPTERQRERFRETLVQLPVPRESLVVHAAASGAALRWPDEWDAVRPGIFLYGGHPAPELEDGLPVPRPVVSVRARVVLVRSVPEGATVGYGATYAASRRERWATLAIGYGDGLPRALSNRGHALIGGRRVAIVGRVSMDVTTVRLDDADAEPGDVATLIGEAGSERITVDDVAAQAGTIGYEVLTGLAPRLPRFETTEESETA